MSVLTTAPATRRTALAFGASALSSIEDSATARLEAEVLLRHVLRTERAELYAHLDAVLSIEQENEYVRYIERRLRREPVSYIVGHKEFFGIDLHVGPGALIPRPETELLVERALVWAREREAPSDGWRIADVGTGSGAIAVSLALHLERCKIIAIDISKDALTVAQANCARHNLHEKVFLLQSDLLTSISSSFDLIIANLPYVKTRELAQLPPEICDYEPLVALNGGEDGLDIYRHLFRQAPPLIREKGLLLAEINSGHSDAALDLAKQALPGAKVELIKDYAGLDRVLLIETN